VVVVVVAGVVVVVVEVVGVVVGFGEAAGWHRETASETTWLAV
jgi:hypothetical protein